MNNPSQRGQGRDELAFQNHSDPSASDRVSETIPNSLS